MRKPVTIAQYRPACGESPEEIANAIASGRATRPTVIPAMRSETNFWRSYVRRRITDFGNQESRSMFIGRGGSSTFICQFYQFERTEDSRESGSGVQLHKTPREGTSLRERNYLLDGFQRRIGLRAAATSSRRLTRVVYGACFTNSGSSAASFAMFFIASMKRSHSSFDSDSVGSIMRAPGTMSGNAVV